MKTKRKAVTPRRDLFAELSKGLDELREEREGKRTLRVTAYDPPPMLTPKDVVSVRRGLHLSRARFARCLRTNPRTLENWEQGRATPNEQAMLLIGLVRKYPDMVERLAEV